jgi:hypothetical protein
MLYLIISEHQRSFLNLQMKLSLYPLLSSGEIGWSYKLYKPAMGQEEILYNNHNI